MNGETLIDLRLQDGYPSRPLKDTQIPAGSAAAFRLRGLRIDDETEVSVVAFNADGVPMAAAAERDDADFLAMFPESHFAAYGSVSNGLRVNLTRGGETYITAYGNLVIEPVDASAVPGDPTAHLITKEELAELFAAMEVADTATQKEVRQALQLVITKMKGLAQ